MDVIFKYCGSILHSSDSAKCPVTERGTTHMKLGILFWVIICRMKREDNCLLHRLCIWLSSWMSNTEEGSKYLKPGNDALDISF